MAARIFAVILRRSPKVTKAGISGNGIAIVIKGSAQVATINSGDGLFNGANVIQRVATLFGKVRVLKLYRAAILRRFTVKTTPAIFNKLRYVLVSKCLWPNFDNVDALN